MRDARGFVPTIVAGAALCALVLVAYAPSLRNGFVWDDDYYVTGNLTLRSFEGLRRIWFELGAVPQYYPLVHTTFWTEYHLWNLNPLGYHVVNVLLHGASAILIWRLLKRLRAPGAWLAAAIFAVHPVEVESVAWVTERKNVLSLTLALASMLCYFRFAPPEEAVAGAPRDPARWRWYALAFVLFAGGLLSKTVVVSLPAVLLVIYWWKRGQVGLREVAPLAPFFVLGVSLGCLTVWMEKHYVGAIGEIYDLTPVERLLIAGRALWFYAAKLAWPAPLVFFYPRWSIHQDDWWQYLFPAAAVAVPVALWMARSRIGRGPLAAVLIFAGVLFPALGFFNVYPFRFSYVADHFQYHASLGLIALAAAAAALWSRRLAPLGQQWARIAAGGLLVVLLALTAQQSLIYKNLDTLYSDTLAKNPRCWVAYINLRNYYDSQHRYAESIELMETCIAQLDAAGVEGNYKVKAHRGLGFALIEVGRHEEAKQHFIQALKVDPEDTKSLYGLGMAKARSADWLAAQTCLERAIELDPNDADGQYGLGVVLVRQGQLSEALKCLEKSLTLRPSNPLAHFELGHALVLQGKLSDGVRHFLIAVQLRPNYTDALQNLGDALLELGDPDQALTYLHRSLRMDPKNAATKASIQRASEAAMRKRAK